MSLLNFKVTIKSMKLLICFIGVSSLLLLVFCLYTTLNTPEKVIQPLLPSPDQQVISYELLRSQNAALVPEKYNEHEIKSRIIREKIKRLAGVGGPKNAELMSTPARRNRTIALNRNIQIFYYAPVHWYRLHPTVPSDRVVSRITENGSAVSFRPNDDQVINIAFYPKRALYNTTESIVREHFHDIQNCGIGTIVLVWHPAFNEGLLRAIFKMAAIHNLKVAIEILEYPERTIEGIRSNIKYFMDLFGKDQDSTLSYFRVLSKQKDLPIFYIRRAYQIADADWMRLLSRNGILTIRGTAYDAIVLAHIGTKEHKSVVRRGGFDGFYTYLPSNGANYASTWKNWSQLKKYGDTYKLMFVPTIGPGYYDRKKFSRSATTNHGINNIKRYRSNGQYYDVAWRTALKNNAQIITINSYNNWVDGTQIEAAIPVFGFRDYLPGPPEKYLDLTQSWIEEYVKYKLNSMARKTDAALGCYDFINNTIC
ncbi:glycoprotein endo-alpha-1,2-mannosidase-like protein [Culex quinquefasciatus]|uniref:glycoprotein endo-alpha-1,2-mannosidase-like protein n=1 Tax=Culex quinquefasciatus TaxID=7176 RepID=UPI0018E32E35|nr:glycoprotein endo-alpha-1,2-mannosidase-like protein [Culex quinquefasciatus]